MPRSGLHHLTLGALWHSAQAAGTYTVSTLGRTLAEEGFIHLSRTDQVATTIERYFRDQHDVVLLTIDPDRLGGALVEEAVGGEVFPHLYGPLPLDAVVAVTPLPVGPDGLPHCPSVRP